MRTYKILVSESQPLVFVDAETAYVDSDGKLTLATREGTRVAAFATWLYFIDVTTAEMLENIGEQFMEDRARGSAVSLTGSTSARTPVISVADHPFLSVGS